jgi:hypothetical protein
MWQNPWLPRCSTPRFTFDAGRNTLRTSSHIFEHLGKRRGIEASGDMFDRAELDRELRHYRFAIKGMSRTIRVKRHKFHLYSV